MCEAARRTISYKADGVLRVNGFLAIMTKLAIEVIRSAVLGVKGGQGHRGRGPPLLRRMILAYLLIMQG